MTLKLLNPRHTPRYGCKEWGRTRQRGTCKYFATKQVCLSVAGNREDQELAVFKTNEYYNKDYMVVSKHPKLMWQLLCQSGNTGKIKFHQWIGFKHKARKEHDDGIKLFNQIFPNMKQDEIEMLASTHTKKELKQLAEEHGIEVKI